MEKREVLTTNANIVRTTAESLPFFPPALTALNNTFSWCFNAECESQTSKFKRTHTDNNSWAAARHVHFSNFAASGGQGGKGSHTHPCTHSDKEPLPPGTDDTPHPPATTSPKHMPTQTQACLSAPALRSPRGFHLTRKKNKNKL